MRDPERIDRVIEALRQAWHRHPDWRLNQLVINACDTPYDCDKPQECGLGLVYYIEDEVMEKRLRGIGASRALSPGIGCRSLAEAVVEVVGFLELSSDDMIDPDSAVQVLEAIAHSLQNSTDTERQAVLEYCRGRAARLSGVDDERAQKRREFYVLFGEAMGLTGA